jgi:glycosyltransferase involved in cell wall biosynthesis
MAIVRASVFTLIVAMLFIDLFSSPVVAVPFWACLGTLLAGEQGSLTASSKLTIVLDNGDRDDSGLASMLITVITPAFNRAHTLQDTYRSLLGQGVHLEWIVIDDGSTDGTGHLIGQLSASAPFRILYIQQKHAGKHVAVNRGVAAAQGELVGMLDSDDQLTPGALDRLVRHWLAIPDRQHYVGVTGLDADQAGCVIGDRFRANVVDASWQEMVYRYRIRGDKWGLQRSDVLRAHPFSEARSFVPEGTVWREIGQRYRTRYVNDVVITVRQGGSDRLSNRPFADQADGMVSFCTRTLSDDIDWFRHYPIGFARIAVTFARGLFHQGVPTYRQPMKLSTWRGRALWALAWPLGWLLYIRDSRCGAALSAASVSGDKLEGETLRRSSL